MFARFSKYAMLRDIRSISTVFSYLTFSDAVGFSFVLPRFIKKSQSGVVRALPVRLLRLRTIVAINVLSTAEVNVMMKQWLARGVPVSSQHVLDAELERDKESKSNLQLNRRLQDAINSAACEDLFKQENGVGRPRNIVIEAQKFRKSLFTELKGAPHHEVYYNVILYIYIYIYIYIMS